MSASRKIPTVQDDWIGSMSASRKIPTVQDDWIGEQQSRDLRCIYIEVLIDT
ncbi:hypothetical protein F511_40335 [Dorcoceras hygrometricum]|uniref:Uncharacterized protein n=1 Tax=Dorcoceras hygrometricum TaxID=472368 RepID=A0A2Z7DGL7_9LAMI|nr:hypothetical protein F511_40335 [Dorcoceras hygrometricum]